MKNSKVLEIKENSNAVQTTTRREFFKKTAIYSAGALSAASVLSPVLAKAA